ncbi:MAG: AzlC family ABC transporter permease [Lachnospiraceae bacterium]|nr:AzlC family ABC transporter permease [Lachnospiraceae bacterium]
MTKENTQIDNLTWFIKGLRDGVPISLGYLAVAFSLGIAARNAGLSAFSASMASALCLASAGEFGGFTLIAAQASYLEMAIMEFVINMRYMLMSTVLSQKLPQNTSTFKRLLLGMTVTDEIFAISVSVPKKLNPFYSYGAVAIAAPGWTLGTALGVIMGNLLPANVVSALSVGLYGMFLAIIIPPARKNRVLLLIISISMILSGLFTYMPLLSSINSGFRIIILTVCISLAAALIFPFKENENEE